MTLAGTEAAPGVELESETEAPPVGAGPVRVTVPVADCPPGTDAGETATAESDGGAAFTVRAADAAVVSREACMEAVPAATDVTTKVLELVPDATETVAGTVATEVFELESWTTAPPAGAGPLSVTVPWEVAPAVRVAGLSVTEIGSGAETLSEPLADTPPATAVMTTWVVAATGDVVTAKVAAAAPALTVTVAGTEAAAELDETRVTTRLPVGALAERVTVPVVPVPPVTLVGAKVTEIGSAEGLTATAAVLAVLA